MSGYFDLVSNTEAKRVEEIQMTVARITMAEFNSETEADTFEQLYAKIAPPALPEAKSLIMIRTGPTSGMSVAIYPDEETAENTLEARKEMLGQFGDTFKDIWHMQGDVSLNHFNTLAIGSATVQHLTLITLGLLMTLPK